MAVAHFYNTKTSRATANNPHWIINWSSMTFWLRVRLYLKMVKFDSHRISCFFNWLLVCRFSRYSVAFPSVFQRDSHSHDYQFLKVSFDIYDLYQIYLTVFFCSFLFVKNKHFIRFSRQTNSWIYILCFFNVLVYVCKATYRQLHFLSPNQYNTDNMMLTSK